MNTDKIKKFLLWTAYIVVIAAIAFAAIKLCGSYLLPFALAFLIAFVLHKPVDYLSEKLNIKRTLVAAMVLIAFYFVILLLVTLLGSGIVSFGVSQIADIPRLYSETIAPTLQEFFNRLSDRFPEISLITDEQVNAILESLYSQLAVWANSIVALLTGFAAAMPAVFMGVLFMVISSFFFEADYHKITAFFTKQFSPKTKALIDNVLASSSQTASSYLKAYSIIIGVTLTELFIGFLLLGINNAFVIALLTAFVDLLPILGSGTVLMPWAIVLFVIGNYGKAIGLFVLWVVISVVRQFLEPKVIGSRIGLPPAVTIVALYLGLKLFGILGMLILPLGLTVIISLNEKGLIHLYR